MDQKFRSRLVAAARRYAAFDKSDPFSLARSFTHIDNGICGYTAEGREAWYDAEVHSTFGVGGTVQQSFTNVTRP